MLDNLKQFVDLKRLIHHGNALLTQGFLLFADFIDSSRAQDERDILGRRVELHFLQQAPSQAVIADLEIEDDQSRTEAFDILDFFKGYLGEDDFIAFRFKQEPEQIKNGLVIVDDENAEDMGSSFLGEYIPSLPHRTQRRAVSSIPHRSP